MAEWTFENHTQAAGDNVGTPNGFWNLNQWAADQSAVPIPKRTTRSASPAIFRCTVTMVTARSTRRHRPATSSCKPFRKGAAVSSGHGATMPDLEAGKLYHAEVSILKQDFSDNPEMVAAGPTAPIRTRGSRSVQRHDAGRARQRHHVGNEFVTFDVVFDRRGG